MNKPQPIIDGLERWKIMVAGADLEAVMAELVLLGSPEHLASSARFRINTVNALGVTMPQLRKLAKSLGREQELALELWGSGVHEARILATLVAEPGLMTVELADAWVKAFDSWDVCDQACSNLFRHCPWAYERALVWAGFDSAKPTVLEERSEFVRRAGFVMMAVLALHDKQVSDERFERFWPVIELGAGDGRNFVKKAVNWALRQLGKRNGAMNGRAVALAEVLSERESKAARWVGTNALRELQCEAVVLRLGL